LARTLLEEHRPGAPRRASRTGEDAIEGDGFGGSVWDRVRNPCSFLALLTLTILILVVGCGGGEEEQAQPPPVGPPDDKAGTSKATGENTTGGSTVDLPPGPRP